MTNDARALSKKFQKEKARRIQDAKKSLFDTYGEVLRTLKSREDALLEEQALLRKAAEEEVDQKRKLSLDEIHKEHEEKLRRVRMGTEELLYPIQKRYVEATTPIRKVFDRLRVDLKQEYDQNVKEAEKGGKIDIEKLRLWWENEVKSQGLEGVKFYWSPEPPKTQPCSVCGKLTQTLIQGVPFCNLDEWRDRSGLTPKTEVFHIHGPGGPRMEIEGESAKILQRDREKDSK